MAAPTDLSPVIQQAAQNPRSASSDGLTVLAVPIGDQIAADRYACAKAARGTPFRGLMMSKIIPAGAMPDSQTTGIGGVLFDSPGGQLI